MCEIDRDLGGGGCVHILEPNGMKWEKRCAQMHSSFSSSLLPSSSSSPTTTSALKAETSAFASDIPRGHVHKPPSGGERGGLGKRQFDSNFKEGKAATTAEVNHHHLSRQLLAQQDCRALCLSPRHHLSTRGTRGGQVHLVKNVKKGWRCLFCLL